VEPNAPQATLPQPIAGQIKSKLEPEKASSVVMLSEEGAARNAPLVRSRSIPTSPATSPQMGAARQLLQHRAQPTWSPISWTTITAAIYLAVAFFLLTRFFVGLAFTRRLLRAAQPIDDPSVTEKLASRAQASQLAFIPQAAESELISVPVTVGALRSTILLPARWRDWDNAKLDAVIAHEVSHVARRDALTQRLSLVHRAIFWFSPLAWWLDRHLADLAEQASDEAALSCGADRKRYARTLLEFFEALQAAPGRVWWQGVSIAKAGQAEQRVDRILSWKGNVAMGFNQAEFAKSSFKKSIAVAVVVLAVPVVYLAAAVRPSHSANAQVMHPPFSAQDQAPPAAPQPAVAPSATPAATPQPAVAPSADVVPPSAPAAAPAPPAAAAITGVIPGVVSKDGRLLVRPVAPVAPVAAVAPPAPPSAWSSHSSFLQSTPSQSTSSQSATAETPAAPASHASPRHRNRSYYSYGNDDNQRFVIASGKTDSLTMSGSTEDAEHVEKLRKTIPGDFIWFERDEKSYIIRDQATVDSARKLWEPQEELGRQQEALGKQQEALGKQQEELGAKMEQVRVNVPDMTADLDKLKAELKQLSSSATMEQIGQVQSEIGDLQSKIGDLQSQAGEQQSKLGEQMSALGEKQGKLGEQQGKLGDQQGELAEKAVHQIKLLFDEALTKGTAQPEP
jgi:beta-lactamase regulating signal transducer with metallopeptidase domain